MTVETMDEVDRRGKEYRAHFAAQEQLAHAGEPVQGDAFLASVEDQLASWLRWKDLDLDVRHDNDTIDGDRSFEVVHHEGGHGARHIRASLVEEGQGTAWRTELFASSDGWIDLRVRNDRGDFAAVPRLAKYLLEVLPIGDGALSMSPEPKSIYPGGADEVVEAVFDRDRRGLVFVCGTSSEHDLLDAFCSRVPKWTRQIYGLGQVYVLTPEATEEFNRVVGVFGALPWAIRTYYPRPDRDDEQDSRRHRYLTTASLARLDDHRIAKLLGTIARSHGANRAESTQVTRVRRIFDRLATSALSDAVTSLPPTQRQPEVEASPQAPVVAPRPVDVEIDQSATSSNVIDVVKRVLGISVITEDALHDRLRQERSSNPAVKAAQATARTLEAQQDKIFRLEDETRAAVELLDDAQVDEAELRERVEELEREGQWLRDRLREKQDFDAAFAQLATMEGAPAQQRPETLTDLVTRLTSGELEGVVFTGDEDIVADVHSHDTMGNAARVAWDVCCALSDFARFLRSGEFEGHVDLYLRNLPDGCRGVPVKKHAMGETEQTMSRFGAERVFPVPTSVDPSGSAIMQAHFKLASIGMVSPRLYYLDRVRQDGNVYIGYIGKHLRNTQTN